MSLTAPASDIAEGARSWDQEDLVIDLQRQDIPKAPRAWDRELKLSSSILHKGRKVWKRYGLRQKDGEGISMDGERNGEEGDGEPRVVKRLCLKKPPMVGMETVKAKPTKYFAMMQEGQLGTPRRKTTRRRSAVAKALVESPEIQGLAREVDGDRLTLRDPPSPVSEESTSELEVKLNHIAAREAVSGIQEQLENGTELNIDNKAEHKDLADSSIEPQQVRTPPEEPPSHPLLIPTGSLSVSPKKRRFQRDEDDGNLITRLGTPNVIFTSMQVTTFEAQKHDKEFSPQFDKRTYSAPAGRKWKSHRLSREFKERKSMGTQNVVGLGSPSPHSSVQLTGASDTNLITFSRELADLAIENNNITPHGGNASSEESRPMEVESPATQTHHTESSEANSHGHHLLPASHAPPQDIPVDPLPMEELNSAQIFAQELSLEDLPTHEVSAGEVSPVKRSIQTIPALELAAEITKQEILVQEAHVKEPYLQSSELHCTTEDRICAKPTDGEVKASSLLDIGLENQGTDDDKLKPSYDQADNYSDDTSMLKEFLTRAQARKAAKSQMELPAPESNSTPRRSPRKVLGQLDRNSPSPTKSRNPVHRPGTPPGKALNGALGGDDLDDVDSEPVVYRRSGRKVPTAKEPAGAPSFIPVRRPDGADPVVLQKSIAQSLAIVTKANTRRNKGASRLPKFMLEALAVPVAENMPAAKVRQTRSTKSVGWDERLVYFQENSTSAEGKGQAAEKRPKVKRAKDLGSSNGTPGKPVKSSMGINGTPAPKRRGRSKEMAAVAVQI